MEAEPEPEVKFEAIAPVVIPKPKSKPKPKLKDIRVEIERLVDIIDLKLYHTSGRNRFGEIRQVLQDVDRQIELIKLLE